MVSGIEIKHGAGKVTIVVRIGEKTARIGVTPEYARRLAAELVTASVQAKSSDESSADDTLSWLERLRKATGGERP